MTKSATTSNKPRKQHTPEFRQEALKLAGRIGVAAANIPVANDIPVHCADATKWQWFYNHERTNMALNGFTPMQHIQRIT